MKGFKVVNKCADGRLNSCTTPTMLGGVEYAFGKVTRPAGGCGPLCVFSNLLEAAIYAICLEDTRQELNMEIYYCDYEPAAENRVWMNNGAGQIESLLPRGTVLADSVKLCRRVSGWKINRELKKALPHWHWRKK